MGATWHKAKVLKHDAALGLCIGLVGAKLCGHTDEDSAHIILSRVQPYKQHVTLVCILYYVHKVQEKIG